MASVAENKAPELPTHGESKTEITGAGGTVIPVMVNVHGALMPHPFAVTVTVAFPVPAVIRIELVVLVPLHPVPETVQL